MINLSKGQKIDLTKNTKIERLRVGLGWDEAVKGADIDCDASCILLDKKDKLAYSEFQDSVVYYGSLSHHGITHSGDNRTGEGEGDDETIIIKLKDVPEKVDRIVVVMNIYQADENNQFIGMLKNAYINVYDDKNNAQLCHYDLNEDYDKCEGVIVGEIYRHDNEWKFSAVGEGVKNASYVRDFTKRYK